jgi:hypothetical protein
MSEVSWEAVVNQVRIPGRAENVAEAHERWRVVFECIQLAVDDLWAIKAAIDARNNWQGPAADALVALVDAVQASLDRLWRSNRVFVHDLETTARQLAQALEKIRVPVWVVDDFRERRALYQREGYVTYYRDGEFWDRLEEQLPQMLTLVTVSAAGGAAVGSTVQGPAGAAVGAAVGAGTAVTQLVATYGAPFLFHAGQARDAYQNLVAHYGAWGTPAASVALPAMTGAAMRAGLGPGFASSDDVRTADLGLPDTVGAAAGTGQPGGDPLGRLTTGQPATRATDGPGSLTAPPVGGLAGVSPLGPGAPGGGIGNSIGSGLPGGIGTGGIGSSGIGTGGPGGGIGAGVGGGPTAVMAGGNAGAAAAGGAGRLPAGAGAGHAGGAVGMVPAAMAGGYPGAAAPDPAASGTKLVEDDRQIFGPPDPSLTTGVLG